MSKKKFYIDTDYYKDTEKETGKTIIRIDEDTLISVMINAIGDDFTADWWKDYGDGFYDRTIAYWCDKIDAEIDYDSVPDTGDAREKLRKSLFYDKNGNYKFDIYSHISKGGKLVLHNIMNDEKYDLTRKNLAEGIRQAIYEYYIDKFDFNIENMKNSGFIEPIGKGRIYQLNSLEIDDVFADMAIQLAIFDDLYYSHESLRVIGGIRVHIHEFQPFAN